MKKWIDDCIFNVFNFHCKFSVYIEVMMSWNSVHAMVSKEWKNPNNWPFSRKWLTRQPTICKTANVKSIVVKVKVAILLDKSVVTCFGHTVENMYGHAVLIHCTAELNKQSENFNVLLYI